MSTQTFNIVLPSDLIEKVDFVAKKEYRNRSELIREALRVYLEDKAEWEEIFAYGKKAMNAAGVNTEDDVNKIVSEYRHGKKS